MTTGIPAWDKWFREAQQGVEVSRSMAPKRVRPTTAERLQKRLEAILGEPVSLPKRHYHGHWQRSSGAWSWSCHFISSQQAVGSQDTMLACLKAPDEQLDHMVDW
jgi:hypothetical protein